MKKYVMWDWNEDKSLYIGHFASNDAFWKYYWDNPQINAKLQKMYEGTWHFETYFCDDDIILSTQLLFGFDFCIKSQNSYEFGFNNLDAQLTVSK